MSLTPKRAQTNQGYWPSSAFGAQSATAKRGVHICKNPLPKIRDGPNTVSESLVSNTELSELFCLRRVPGRELSEFLSAYYFFCDKANSPSFFCRAHRVRLSEFSSPKQYSRNSIPPVPSKKTFLWHFHPPPSKVAIAGEKKLRTLPKGPCGTKDTTAW